LDNGVAINGTIALHESRLMQDKLRYNFAFIVAKREHCALKTLDDKERGRRRYKSLSSGASKQM